MLADDLLSGLQEYREGRRDRMNLYIGCEMHSREVREPAGDILFADGEGSSGKPDKRIEEGTPRDLVVVERIIKMARADWIFGENQRGFIGVPDGDRPI